MRVSSFLAKIQRDVFGQAGPKWERARTQPSAAWIQERVHVAIGEEALQSDRDEIYRQWMSSPAPLSPRSPVCAESTEKQSPGARRKRQRERERVLSLSEGQQRNDRTLSLTVGTL